MEKIRLVIFDMDGVIFDTERVYLNVWKQIFNEYNLEFKDETYISVMGTGRENVKKVFSEKYGESLPIEEMYLKKDEALHNVIIDEGIPVKDGAIEILNFLKENNIHIALGTSAQRKRVEQQLKDKKLKEFFEIIVTRNDVQNGKPNPDIFLKVAEELDIDPGTTLVIEDSLSGIKAARAAHMQYVHVEDLKKCDEEILQYTNKSFKNLLEIKEYLYNKKLLK